MYSPSANVHCYTSPLITKPALYDTHVEWVFYELRSYEGFYSNGSRDKLLYGLRGVKVTTKIASFMIAQVLSLR